MPGIAGSGSPADGCLAFSIDDGVARLTLNRPQRFNALDVELARSFRGAVSEVADRTDVHVVVLSGAGRAFCGGGDVGEMASARDRREAMRVLVEEMHAALALLSELPVVVISAVHGVVAGGGIGLMLAGDVVLAELGTRFVSAYGGIGVSPDCGASVLLPAAVGMTRALEFTIAARALTADEALEWGMVTEVAAPGELPARVDAVIEKVLDAPEAAGRSRRLMRSSRFPDFRERLAAEAAEIVELAGTVRAGELMAAFARR